MLSSSVQPGCAITAGVLAGIAVLCMAQAVVCTRPNQRAALARYAGREHTRKPLWVRWRLVLPCALAMAAGAVCIVWGVQNCGDQVCHGFSYLNAAAWIVGACCILHEAGTRQNPSCLVPSVWVAAFVNAAIMVSSQSNMAANDLLVICAAIGGVGMLASCCCCWFGFGVHEEFDSTVHESEALLANAVPPGGHVTVVVTDGGKFQGHAVAAGLNPQEVAGFYDNFGSMQDYERYYTDDALKVMKAKGNLTTASHVLEFGCGTGALAESLLRHTLPTSCMYTGTDISSTMCRLTTQRTAPWQERCRIVQSDGSTSLSYLGDESVDRIISTYVFDALSDEYQAQVLASMKRVLRRDGLLCIVSLTDGNTPLAAAMTSAWIAVYKVSPRSMGGCRPVRLVPLLQSHGWTVVFEALVTQAALTSQVVIASPVGRG